MPTFTMTKTYVDGNVLNESDLDNMKSSTETFLNTTKIDDDNIQDTGISKSKLKAAVQEALVPPGTMFPYGGTVEPSGYLLCDGSTVSRTTFSTLFTAISTNYGVGDGSTTFNLPDLRGRVAFGKDNMDNTTGTGGGNAGRLTTGGNRIDGDTIGASGGLEDHTLLTAETPAHLHTIIHGHNTTDPGHKHTFSRAEGAGAGTQPLQGTVPINALDFDTTVDGTGLTVDTFSGNSGSVGSDNAHDNIPPGLITTYIIKT